ncbi:hypothetical protein TWF506_008107 [Arthrobotrys conoides]|uniref:Uncharacterized protein n=1 Tax=Arthrobotrys conoides TaxID=74498 RepID=A0AAN8NMR1_9PEZI
MGNLSSKPKRISQPLPSPSSSFVSAYEVIDHPNYFSNTPAPSYRSHTRIKAMPQNCYQEHNPPTTTATQSPQIPQPRVQRWSTPVEPPSKNYSSPPRSRSRRHSTAEEVSPTAKLGSNGAGPQFRDVDWGSTTTTTTTTTTTDNGKMLRDRVSEISKCASDVEKLVDGYLEEHSEMQKKLKAKVETGASIAPAVKTRIPRNIGKPQALYISGSDESSVPQVQGLQDRISELERKIKHMEKHHQKELSERERSNQVSIQKVDANHKVEVESLQTKLADVSLKLQNHKTKVESLTDQKAHLIFEKDQLQSKLEDHALETTAFHSKLQNQAHEIHDLQSRVKKISHERDESIKKYNIVQDESKTLKNIIRNCKYCAGVWEFTQHRGSIDVNVWYCDIEQDGGYVPPSSVEMSLGSVNKLSDTVMDDSDIPEELLIEKFKVIIYDIEKLCNSIAFRASYRDFYMKKIDINTLSSFKCCLQNQTFDAEIFLPYLQHQIWHTLLQSHPIPPPDFSETQSPPYLLSQILKLNSAEASNIPLNYKALTTLISTITTNYSSLILSQNFLKSHLKFSLTPLNPQEPTMGIDLFPIIRRTVDNALITGRISVKNIEENAIIIPITPILYHTPLTVPQILIQGTAIVYEPKRSAPVARPPSINIPGKPTPKPRISQNNPPSPDTPTQEEPNSPNILLHPPSFSKPKASVSPPQLPVLRPCLHRKPKLPPLDTTSTTATPTNSPVLQRTTATTTNTPSIHKPPPPQIPPKNLALKRGSIQNSICTRIGAPHETKDSEANPNKELQSSQNTNLNINEASKPSSDVNFSRKWSHKPNPSAKINSGTPLAAIWRKLEELDKKNASRTDTF